MRHILLCFFALLLASNGLAQNRLIKGIVVSSEDNEPIIGATVKVQGTLIATPTDVDGNFTIANVPADAKNLEVSYIGYKTQTVAIKPEMKISLEADSHVLEEVVVTGMQKMDKRLFSGSTAKIDAGTAKLDGMADISRSLEGRAAGVSVQNVSGTFGTAPKIQVRGATSIYGSNKPLWVVDGVILEDAVELSADALSTGDVETLISSAISGLNTDDIESFQILKDGSATSIYGARAMAGVIVVTTKKGKAGQSQLNYTGEFTIRMKPHYRNYNIMNSQEQMDVYKELAEKGWLNFSGNETNGVYNASNSGVYGKMWHMINTYDPETGQFMLENTLEARNAYLQSAERRNTDWFDELFYNTLLHNHSLSISSGSEKAAVYASLSAMSDAGWYKRSDVKRYTANLNTSYNIGKHVSINLLSNASYRKQKAPGTMSQSIDIVNGEINRNFDINPFSYSLNSSRTLDPNEYYTRNYADFNIFNELENNYIELNIVDLKFQGELKWKPIDELEFSALGAIKYSMTAQEHHMKDDSNQAGAYRAMGNSAIRESNRYLYTDPDDPYSLPITILPEGGIYQRNDYKAKGFDFRASGSWNHLFGEHHLTNFYAGMEANSLDRDRTYFNGWGMQYTMGETPFYVYQYFKQSIEQGSNYYSLTRGYLRSVAFFGNLNYAFDSRYTINGTVRYEGTNKLGKSRSARWLPTWNISGRWNIDEEHFFASLKRSISHAALRVSYSLTADRGPASVSNSRVIIVSDKPYRPFTSVQESALALYDLENSELTYEKKRELNLGLDLGFIGNRINLTADWYTRDNYDLIGVINTQGVGGSVSKYANVASMKSYGVEVSLSSTNIKTKNFTWTTDFIYSLAKNKVTDLESVASLMDLVAGSGFALEGYPVRALFSIPFAGLDENGIPTFYAENGKVTSTDISFQSRENLDFLHYEGPTDPTSLGSFSNTFSFKGFHVNLFLTYSAGNVVRLDPAFSARYTDLTATSREFKNRWIMPGDEKKTTVPAIISYRQYQSNRSLTYAYNAYNYSTERIANGSFIRLKEVSLSYDFPKTWVEKLRVRNMSLKLQATNLCLLYADKKLNGQDPEFINAGGVASPVPRQFTLTVRIGL